MATMKNTPIKTAKNGKITASLYYDFIEEIYTIERKTKFTQWKERTKDRNHATKLFYLFLYYSKQELEKKLTNILNKLN